MVIEKVKSYFNGDKLAVSVWKGKYATKDEEDPSQMHLRMAKEFGRIEAKYDEKTSERKDFSVFSDFYYHNIMAKPLHSRRILEYFNKFNSIVPQGSIMAMLGNKDKIGSLSNCFVIGQPYDSYGGIMQKDQELVQLMKRRGGVGVDISTLRPNNTAVSNAAGSSTGAVSFMHRYSNSTREVAQNGRRGALMISIDCRHPDVLDFINVKKDLTQVTGANISVQLRDDFMQAVKDDGDYLLRFPCNIEESLLWSYTELKTLEYNKIEQIDKDLYVKKIKAKEYFNTLIENNWLSAEPGSIFVDRHWNYSPDGVYEQYRGVTTNPCGEIFMQMYDACRLMALNYFSIVENAFKEGSKINYEKLYEIAYIQQRLADDLVDLEIEHIDRILEKIEKDEQPNEVKEPERALWKNIRRVASSGRRTGCGFTALGDMLAALNLKYDSVESKEVIKEVSKTKLRAELDCTIDMAIERGSFEGSNRELEFPNEQSSTEDIGGNDFYTMLLSEFFEQSIRMQKYGRRNVSWSTVSCGIK